MAENIELKSFSFRNGDDGDFEEYHEIEHVLKQGEPFEENSFVSKFAHELVNNYEFFTQVSRKTEPKEISRKKKRQHKEKPFNMMDMVSTQLASSIVPVTETRIEFVENKQTYQNSYVRTFSRYERKYQRRKAIFDSKNRQSPSVKTQKLRPMYPNLIENFTEDSLPNFQVEYVGPSSFCDLINEYHNNSNVNGNGTIKFLDIAIKNLQFKYHHDFSLEDLLCVKLIDIYREYEKISEILKELAHEIKVNRETKDNLKKDLLKISPNKKDSIRFDATIRKYAGQLLKLKLKYWENLKTKKELTHILVSMWSDIEMIREKFKCTNTPYNLVINKKTLNDSEFKKVWNDMYEEEWTDMLTKIEYDYGTECIEYKESKQQQTNNNSTKKKIIKPKIMIDEEIIKDNVEEIVNNFITRERIYFTLKIDETDSKVQGHKYNFEIYVDNIFVCESDPHTSTNRWHNVNFDECFSIEILPNNQSLRVVLLENEEVVAQFESNLNEFLKKVEADYTKIKFTYDKKMPPTPESIGSGYSIKEITTANKVRLKSSNSFTKENIKTICEMSARIGFNENPNHSFNESIKEWYIIDNKLSRLLHGIDNPQVEILADLISKIYGKDVTNNEAVLNTLRQFCKTELKSDEDFDFDENSSDYVRLKLLHIRNNGGFSDIENKIIPIHGSQISTEQLNCLQKTKEKDFDLDYLRAKEANMDPIELQRFIGVKFMQKLNKKMLKNLNEHLMAKTRKDVVRESREFNWRSFFTRGNNTSTTSISSSAKRQILLESLVKEQDIYITVQRAFNLLDRSKSLDDEGDTNEETIAGYKVHPLRPFVRVSYRGTSKQTVTAIGCHPSWNHTLKLCTRLDPLSALQIDIFDECKMNINESSDDQSTLGRTVHYRYFNKWLGTMQVPLFSVLTLGSLRGTFKINSPPTLFGYENVHHKESHSLIPEITSLMKKQTSYITLHVTTGLAHLGGFQEFTQPLPSSAEDNFIIKHLNTFVTAFINDFPNRSLQLTLIDSAGRNKCVTQFLQPIPFPDWEYFPKNPKSCGSALSKSSGLSRSSSSKSSGRKRDVDLEANDEKESVYSQETNIKGGDSLMKTINSCLKYVALIPCYGVINTHVVTLMGLELLKVLHGSPLDHSILLSSYFLYLGIKSWIAIGLGLPRGRSSYVLIQYDLTARRLVLTSDELFRSRGFLSRNDGYLWYVCDAVSGDRHELRDVGCPLKTVEYVFDNENIWVNAQSSQDCENVSFDLSKSSDWQTVFDKNIYVMKEPIVNDSQLYSSPPNVEMLRQNLEAKIKGKIQKWRPHMKTIWNRYCSSLLRDALPFWEYWAFNPTDNKPGFSQKIKQLMVTYNIYGFPLNIPFVNTKTVISAVKATALHLDDNPGVEFALGVEVFPYPNNVLSVWVFLATITRV